MVEKTNRLTTRAKVNLTLTEESNPVPSQRKGKAKKSADSEEDPEVQEAICSSLLLEQPPVPSPRASKRTRYTYYFLTSNLLRLRFKWYIIFMFCSRN